MRKNHLLVLNYVMDEEDQLLSHQAEIVNLIAREFDHISVLTGRIGKVTIPSNVTLKSYNWVRGKKISNIFNLIKSYILIKKSNDISIIDSSNLKSLKDINSASSDRGLDFLRFTKNDPIYSKKTGKFENRIFKYSDSSEQYWAATLKASESNFKIITIAPETKLIKLTISKIAFA